MDLKLMYAEDINEKEVENVLKKIGATLPEVFLLFIKDANGAYVSPDRVMVNGHEEMINNFVSLNPDSEAFILDYKESIGGENIIPFARDAEDNFFAFCFKENDYSIVFWNQELKNCELICKSFEDFLKSIYQGEVLDD